jgi:small subunit ribosomal protein S21
MDSGTLELPIKSKRNLIHARFCTSCYGYNLSNLLFLLIFFYLTSARQPTDLAVNIKVNVGDGEPIESALRRFKREVSKSGHLMELRHKRHFENKQEKAIRKVKEGRMRKKFERMQRKRMTQRV